MTKLRIPTAQGFQTVGKSVAGITKTAYLSKFSATELYEIGEPTFVTGLCNYSFLHASGIVHGILFYSPAIHTVATPIMLKIGACVSPFTPIYNLQPQGVLLYEAADSSIIAVPMNVSSPMLVEVEL